MIKYKRIFLKTANKNCENIFILQDETKIAYIIVGTQRISHMM